jgi:hypothetical protein
LNPEPGVAFNAVRVLFLEDEMKKTRRWQIAPAIELSLTRHMAPGHFIKKDFAHLTIELQRLASNQLEPAGRTDTFVR